MEDHRGMRALLLIAFGACLFAASPLGAAPMRWLTENEIRYVFIGREVKGHYHNGVAFTEVYRRNGNVDYRDTDRSFGGKWRLTDGSICVEYQGLEGGCFKIRQHSANCFEYWLVADASSPAKPAGQWLARSAQSGNPPTCPVQ
jgi:hypothetical protein